jgi:hypothetical protein
MSNVNSAGLFGGRVGTSMDYSQLLEVRRKYIGVNAMRVANPTNSAERKPRFNQDKFTREPSTNGAVDFYFTRGLYPLFGKIRTGK